MILEDVLKHFNISDEGLPDHLLTQTFNEVFLDGRLTKQKDNYVIAVTTRQNVTYQMHIRPREEFPLIIMSVLPNGKLNGMKFGRNVERKFRQINYSCYSISIFDYFYIILKPKIII